MKVLFPQFKDTSASLGESIIALAIVQVIFKAFSVSYEIMNYFMLTWAIGYLIGLIFASMLVIMVEYFFLKQ